MSNSERFTDTGMTSVFYNGVHSERERILRIIEKEELYWKDKHFALRGEADEEGITLQEASAKLVATLRTPPTSREIYNSQERLRLKHYIEASADIRDLIADTQ